MMLFEILRPFFLVSISAATTKPNTSIVDSLNMTSTLSLLHFNDVYRVTPQKLSSHSLETIDVTQFTALLHDLRDQWTLRDDGNRDGLVLFSGDVFSPSIESSITRGSHMVIFTVNYSNNGFDHGLCK